jgi:hypothetical protein
LVVVFVQQVFAQLAFWAVAEQQVLQTCFLLMLMVVVIE